MALDRSVVVVVRGDAPGISHYQPGTLAADRICPVAADVARPTFSARVAPLSDGAYVAAYDEDIVLARCDGRPRLTTHVGRSNRTPIAWGDHLLVADRYADPGATNPLLTQVRSFDRTLAQVAEPFSTSILAGFMFLDPAAGRVWFAAEGGGVVGDFDPDNAADLSLLRMGQDVDIPGLPVDPEDHRVWFTARLTRNVGWIDLRTGEVARSELLPWPVGGLRTATDYWAVSNTEGRLFRLDPDNLAVTGDFPLDVTPSEHLLCDAMADGGERGTVLVTLGLDNALPEVDANSGEVVGRWRLGGSPPSDPRHIGRVEIARLSDHEVVTLRTNDGVATRVDLDSGATTSIQVAPDGEPDGDVQQQQLHVRSDDVVMVRGHALDPETLAPLDAEPLPSSVMLGEVGPARWLVGNAPDSTLAIVDPTGLALAAQVVPVETPPDPHLFYDAAHDRVVYNDLLAGAVVPVPLAELREAAGM